LRKNCIDIYYSSGEHQNQFAGWSETILNNISLVYLITLSFLDED